MNTNTVVGFLGGSLRNQLNPITYASASERSIELTTDGGTALASLAIPLQTNIIGSGNPLSTESNPALLAMGGRLGLRYQYAGRPGFTSDSFDSCRPFLLRFSGKYAPASDAGNGFLAKLYLGAVAGGTAIGTAACASAASETRSRSFAIEAELIWNSAGSTGNINGQFWYFMDGTTVAYATWAQTAVANVTAAAGLVFAASFKFNAAAGGTITPSEFSISQL